MFLSQLQVVTGLLLVLFCSVSMHMEEGQST